MTNIKIQKTGPIGEIILNSPQTLNLVEEDTFSDISAALDGFEGDNGIKAVLLRAVCGASKKTGEKIFSAGVNLKKYEKKFELLDKNPEQFKSQLTQARQLLYKTEKYSKPVVIGIDGLVVGGFFELALACDVVLASKEAVFSLNEVNIGLIPGYGGINRLLRLVGKNRAYEIMATGRQIKAEEAYQLGIASKILPGEEFLNYCNGLASKPETSLKLLKQVINGAGEVEGFMQAAGSGQARTLLSKYL